jgi:lysyl-tRNA synthetase class 1
MDGLRKVPDNVPNQEMLREHLGKPLTAIPDPFGKFDSFARITTRCCANFSTASVSSMISVARPSSTRAARSTSAAQACCALFRDHGYHAADLRAERAATYSPVLPVSPKSGIVLQVPLEVVDAEAGIVRFEDEGETIEHNILSGGAKLQWKVDWAMRWVALDVDYEMYGKDLTDSGVQSGKIAQVLGGRKPEGLIYEMFLDEKGEKISKSKGNGLSLEEWLTYGSEESLAFYAYREPKSAKQLHIGVIPRAVDEYEQFRGNYASQPLDKQLGNPVHHIHAARGEAVPTQALPVSYGLLLNLVGVMGAEATAERVWAYLSNYVEGASEESYPQLAGLVGNALAYNRDFIAPTLKRRKPEENEARALAELDAQLGALSEDASAEDIQNIVYDRQGSALRVRAAARLVQGAVSDLAGGRPRPAHGQLHRALRDREQPAADCGGSE